MHDSANENSPSFGFQLRTAAIHNKVNEMERLLRKDPSLVNDAAALSGEHGAVESGLTALHVACQLGFDECVFVCHFTQSKCQHPNRRW